MTELDLFDDEPQKTMTVKEVAESLGTAQSTIRNKVAELFPGLTVNGVATVLNEAQVTAIKKNLVPRDLTLKSKVDSATTDIEMMQQGLAFAQWALAKIAEQERQLSSAIPKIQAHDALMKTETDMSITQAAKHFKLHPKTQVFPYLRSHGFLTSKDLPTQYALDAGVLSTRQSEPDKGGKTHTQAVVKACNLDRFRKLIADKIV